MGNVERLEAGTEFGGFETGCLIAEVCRDNARWLGMAERVTGRSVAK